MNRVTITCDGSCIPNPGPGAWAYVLRNGADYKEGCALVENTTNNRMEFEAMIQAVSQIREPAEIHIRSDSKIALCWAKGHTWEKFVQRKKLPEAYAQWIRFAALTEKHTLTFEWVRGHNGDPDNERCDELANHRVTMSPESYIALGEQSGVEPSLIEEYKARRQLAIA